MKRTVLTVYLTLIYGDRLTRNERDITQQPDTFWLFFDYCKMNFLMFYSFKEKSVAYILFFYYRHVLLENTTIPG